MAGVVRFAPVCCAVLCALPLARSTLAWCSTRHSASEDSGALVHRVGAETTHRAGTWILCPHARRDWVLARLMRRRAAADFRTGRTLECTRIKVAQATTHTPALHACTTTCTRAARTASLAAPAATETSNHYRQTIGQFLFLRCICPVTSATSSFSSGGGAHARDTRTHARTRTRSHGHRHTCHDGWGSKPLLASCGNFSSSAVLARA